MAESIRKNVAVRDLESDDDMHVSSERGDGQSESLPQLRPVAPPLPETARAAPQAPTTVTIATPPAPAPTRARRRGFLRIGLMLLGLVVVVVGSLVFWLGGGRYVSADDAYVQAAKLMVSTDVSGLVATVNVKENQHVKAGDTLFSIDPAQFQIALAAAKANLDQVRISLQASQADYKRMQSDIAAQEAQVSLAQTNNDRAVSLLKSNTGTQATYDQTRFTLAAAQNTLASLREQSQVALMRLGGNADAPVDQLPQYMQAKSQVDEAQRQLDHTVVRAPFSGIVTQVTSLQPGTYLVSQTAAMTNTGAVGLVATDNMWIDANLKETDLDHVRVGQPVSISIDSYPDHSWTGHVRSIDPATGSEFSVLPAQNSSGNWVKIVQRLAVEITIDTHPGDPPLRAGMSASVSIDTGYTRNLGSIFTGSIPPAAIAAQPANDQAQ